ncbi:DUF3558 domain-containing protein [Actinomycetospora atypica]|uniref:DUF3558 domain-containing protein n=1 Tax=Actinomycetospora atypica TaxID=1290095 RepID=A0ABV9YKT5_9PSEU
MALTSCASRQVPPEQTTSNVLPDRYGAPSVERPVDVAGVVDRPCSSLLTAAELRALGYVSPGRERRILDVDDCYWVATDQQSLSLAVDADRDLLADTYRTRNDPVFVPTTVEGFPAVRQKSSPGAPNICTLTTGLGPRQALEATWVGRGEPRPGNDACEFAEQATALVVRKLPPAR